MEDKMVQKEEYQYIAGLIDSDGNIDLSKRKRKNGYAVFPKITIGQKFEYSIKKIKEILGVGFIYKQKNGLLIFEINSKKCFSTLKEIEKYLVLKRDRASFINNYSIDDRFSLSDINNIRKQFIEISTNEICYVESFSHAWFAGFIDGDGCFLSKKPNNSKKLNFELVVSYHKKYNALFLYLCEIYGGRVRDLLYESKATNTKQWCISLNSNMLYICDNIYPYLNLKKYQCLGIIEWIKKYPTHKRNCCTLFDSHILHSGLSSCKKNGLISPNLYQFLAKSTAIYNDKYKIIYPALGLAGECGEVCEKIKKTLRDNKPLNKEDMMKELSDPMWYIANLAYDLEFTLEDIILTNVNKLQDRKERGVIGGSGDNR
jgi:NTP pyrophosphatase (non-canonical NTP hydrolase)